jgi:hypothetical protein
MFTLNWGTSHPYVNARTVSNILKIVEQTTLMGRGSAFTVILHLSRTESY